MAKRQVKLRYVGTSTVVSVPLQIMEALRLEIGSMVEFDLNADNESVTLRPCRPHYSLRDLLPDSVEEGFAENSLEKRFIETTFQTCKGKENATC